MEEEAWRLLDSDLMHSCSVQAATQFPSHTSMVGVLQELKQ